MLRWTLRPSRSLNLWTPVLLLAVAIPASARDNELCRKIQTMVENTRNQLAIPLITVALVDGPRTVFTVISGAADSETLYRAGSLSNLLTAIAVMQQVEKASRSRQADLPISS
ncbi:MAG: hypothetical protein LC126_15190 [Bryobacterales bacterium]|nr:hypothetical protein [Bryobacterales bacterium]